VTIEATLSGRRSIPALQVFNWSGNTLISSDDLSKLISLKTGNPVDEPQLDRDPGAGAQASTVNSGREAVVIKPVPSFADKYGSATLFR